MCISYARWYLNINHLLLLMTGGEGSSFLFQPRRKLDGEGETGYQAPERSLSMGLSRVMLTHLVS